MTVVDRIRNISAELGASCAFLDTEDGPTPVCFSWRLQAPFVTVRRAKIAWAVNRCPLCFWTLIRTFGLDRQETMA